MRWLRIFNRGESKALTRTIVRNRFRPFGLSRAWKAATQDRLTADWLSAGSDINQELKSQLDIIRRRARELEQNSNLARSFLSLCETHIVGPDGFTLQVQGKQENGELDVAGNKLVEKEFKRWAKRGVCEITGRHSLQACERITARTTARDGDGLIRLHDVRPSPRNPWGLVIEMLDPSRIDHRLSDDLKNGNRIRLGIEVNQAGRPVAYWLKQGERNGWVVRRETHERVPAEDIIHWLESDRPEQLRGVSWLASAMLDIHQIGKFYEAAVIAARAGASKMGFIIDKDGNKHAMDDDDVEKDDDGNLIEEFEPGMIGNLSGDKTFQSFDPKYPHEVFDPFTKALKRDTAMGLNVSYHALTGDLTDVNFSSIRTGTLEEREKWKVKQDSFSACVLVPIFLRWLGNAATHGRFGSGLPHNDTVSRYAEHRWQGRRWSWVDPKKDIEAIIAAMNAGLTSPQRVASEMGVDVEEVLEEIAAFQKRVEEKKVVFPVIQIKAAAGAKAGVVEEDKKDAA